MEELHHTLQIVMLLLCIRRSIVNREIHTNRMVTEKMVGGGVGRNVVVREEHHEPANEWWWRRRPQVTGTDREHEVGIGWGRVLDRKLRGGGGASHKVPPQAEVEECRL
jgi:hypothetical protein